MAKINLFLVTTCLAFRFLTCSESQQDGEAEQSNVSNQSSESAVKVNSDRMGAFTQTVAIGGGGGGFQQRPYLPPTQLPILVECYVCTDCPNIQEDTPSKLCPHTLDPNKKGKCVTYAEKYRHMQRPWYIRGCASERGSCDDIRKAHENHVDIVNLLSCIECEGERCNTNGASTFTDCTIAFMAMIVTPVLTKFTLS